MIRRPLTHAVWLTSALALALPAFAQEEPDLASIDEIVVTITKREESLNEVAATISAFGEDAIEQVDIQSVSDIANLIPNMQIKGDDNGGISIRGVSQSFTSQGPVATHMNGIWRRDSGNSFLGLFYDLENIQVQRGPVGTVYGRNATAGAIDVNWKQPHSEYEVGGDVTVGNKSLYLFRGHANIPLLGEGVNERLMGRFAFQRETRDNYYDLLNAKSRLGGTDAWYFRGSLRSVLTEDLEITLRGSYGRDREAQASQSKPLTKNGQFAEGLFNLGPLGAHPFDPLNGYQKFLTSLATNPASAPLVGAYGAFNASPTPQDAAFGLITQGFALFNVPAIAPNLDRNLPLVSSDGQTASNSSFFQIDPDAKASTVDATLEWSLRDLPLLGDIDLKVIGGWDRWGMRQTPEADGTNLVILDTQSHQHRKTWVGEVNLVSNNEGPVDWIVGFFYFDSDHRTVNGTITPFALPPLVPTETDTTEKGYAPFAQANARIFELFGDDPLLDAELWAGIRYNHDESEVESFNPSPAIPAAGNPPTVGRDVTFREVTYEFGLRWFVNEDHTLYVKWSKGYKPGITEPIFDRGNISGNPRVFINSVDPEIIRAWEGGWKATWWDSRLQTALTYFHYSYSDLQVPKITGGVVLTENAASATNQGVELEVRAQPTEEWNVLFSAGWLDATFDDFCSNDELDFSLGDPSCADPSVGGPGFLDLTGNDLEDSPSFKLSLLTSYEFDLGEMGTITPVVSFTWTDDYFRRPFNRDDYDKVDAYTRTDFRLMWRSVDEQYGVELFVQNIEDETVYARTIAVELPTSVTGFGLLPPRVYGIRFSYHWGGY